MANAASRYQMHVRDGNVMRGNNRYTLRGIYAPAFARPGAEHKEVVTVLHNLTDAGANTVCFDLHGVAEDGATVSEQAAQAFKKAMAEVRGRYMAGICRLFPDGASKDLAYREKVVKAVAQSLDDNTAIYWVEGPHAEQLTKLMQAEAPDLLVMGPAPNAGIRTIKPGDQAKGAASPILRLNAIPEHLAPQAHFVLLNADSAHAQLEHAMRAKDSPEDWTPDNSVLSEEERANGWIALFDGQSMDGWVPIDDGGPAYRVRDGMLEWVGDRPNTGDIRTVKRYEDFILRLEWKIVDGGNAGIYLRAPRTARESKIGFEFQLRGDYGKAPTTDQTGAIYDALAPQVNAGKPAGEWNTLEITLDGPHAKAVLNGKTVWDLNFDEHDKLQYRLRRGFIGLQDHNHYAAFRNIRIKPL